MSPSAFPTAHRPFQGLSRYEIVRSLGEGGAGRVYEAVLQGPGGFRKPVALKVLKHGAAMLRREARMGGLLRHRNLVDVYEVGEHEGLWYCALELCIGELSRFIPLPPRAVVEVGLQVCAAMQYAHEELGLVHRDLKPDNLLLGMDGAVKVADLGIARAEGFDGDDRIRGTLGYMAPEQARGEELDARADVYALGVTLAELATGLQRRASETLDLDSLATTLAEDHAEWQDRDTESVPSWLRPVVDRCLESNPDGRWRDMDEVADALRQLRVDGPGLAEVFEDVLPRPPGNAAPPGRVPEELELFVGREHELAEVARALDLPGIVTLKGPAGVGKSRLAAEVARVWQQAANQAARFCSLGAAQSMDAVYFAVARALDVELRDSDPEELLGQVIASRGALLVVLDDAEHLEGLAAAVERWRAFAPDARLLVTSRRPMGLPHEEVIEVGPLGPGDATALLAARARERGMDVVADPRLPDLAARLDGLPLALELAAGRLGVLTVADVLDRFELSLLRSGAEDRHGTLEDALDWSWELLTTPQQRTLAQLSVFSGGFELEAAEEVVVVPGAHVIEELGALVDCSMVHALPSGRFELLSSVAAYARRRLADPGPTEVRHGQHYARLGTLESVVALDLKGGVQRRWAMVLEIDNLLEACRRAVRRGDARTACDTTDAIWAVFGMRGPADVVVQMAGEALSMSRLEGPDRARVQLVFAAATARLGSTGEALEQYREALNAFREAGDRVREGRTLSRVGSLLHNLGRMDEALEAYEASLAVLAEAGDRMAQGNVLGNLGLLHGVQGRIDESRAHHEAALVIHVDVGNRRSEGIARSNLGMLLRQLGRTEAALAHYQAVLEIHREVGDRRSEGVVLGHLGVLEQQRGNFAEARDYFERALVVDREVGSRQFEAVVAGNLAALLHSQGRLDEAGEMFLTSLRACVAIGDRRNEAHVRANLSTLQVRQGRTREARENLSAALTVASAIGDKRLEGYVHGRLAMVLAMDGALDEALQCLDRGEPLLREIRSPELLAELLAVRAQLAWRTGRQEEARAVLAEAEATAPAGNPDSHEAIAAARREIDEGAPRTT